MATGDITAICNRALLSIGSRAFISGLNEKSTQADACLILFTPTYESLSRSADWNCLRQQQSLGLIAAAQGTPENPNGTSLPLSPQPWLYSYQLPNDCLQMRYVMPNFMATLSSGTTPNTTAPAVPAPIGFDQGNDYPYIVAYGTDASGNPIQVVLTNVENAIAVYTVNQPNPAIWDSDFQSAFVALLAAYLVPALSLNIALMDRQLKIADSFIQRARIRDGDEGYTKQDHTPDWIKARNGGAIWGYEGGPGPYFNWSSAYGQY